jgi:hypothetical protein
LYDLPADDTGLLFLRGVSTDMIVLAWLYPRATRWVLDRQGVKGKIGLSLLDSKPDDEDDDENATAEDSRGIGSVDVPNRTIYCLDLRNHPTAATYLDEIRRIVRESQTQVVTLSGLSPPNPSVATNGNGKTHPSRGLTPTLNVLTGVVSTPSLAAPENGQLVFDGRGKENGSKRRWYPVIDYSRCTNCMECIDFCLFGVYGVDAEQRILVEQQDNCKKGCPACSRVCPENAIIFPEYKSPAIAGAQVGADSGIKIDLSKLFGGDSASALEMAVAERDRELVADGRSAVGMTVGVPKRQSNSPERPRDELDDLVDGLDSLNL